MVDSLPLIHALDLRGPARKNGGDRPALVFSDANRLLVALDEVRPIEAAPSIGEAARAVRSASTPRALRRALAELDALVNRAAHARTKRGERANLVALLALLCGLHAVLGLPPDADVRLARRRLDELRA